MKHYIIFLIGLGILFTNEKAFAICDSLPQKPDSGVYFISRNAQIDSTVGYLLFSSIRPVEEEDNGTEVITIKSYGEGWLDKDSVPLGEWRFYGSDEKGKYYLFKTGQYDKANVAMFRLRDEDQKMLVEEKFSSISILNNISLRHPFVKTKQWSYYHQNGKVWKMVNFKDHDLYIRLGFIPDSSSREIQKVNEVLRSNWDEWPPAIVNEYNEKGKLYRRVYYFPDGDLYKKEMLNP